MKTNVFLNSYKKKEDELTYAFFSMLEIINSKSLFEYLSGVRLTTDPVRSLRLLPVGKNTNPDGELILEREDDKRIKLLFENKTKIRSLDKKQLLGHLELCEKDDRLLVITPRKSDIQIIKSINDVRILFFTWSEIASELNKNYSNEIIAKQFIEYGRISGQFEELGELSISDIDIYLKYINIRFNNRLESIFTYLLADLQANESNIPLCKNDIAFEDNGWGRNGLEIGYYTRDIRSYGQWFFIGLYDDSSDHGIPFKNDVPEIVIFFDVDPEYRELLLKDKIFCNSVLLLSDIGFENNLNGKTTTNLWRLFYKRKSISDFPVLTASTIKDFLFECIDNIASVGLLDHMYIKEFNLPTASS